MSNFKRTTLNYTIRLSIFGSLSMLVPSIVLAQSGAVTLEQIVVTANKREENVQDSSLIIEAYGREELSNAGIVDASGLSKLSSGLQIGLGGPSLQVYIRGVGNPGSTSVTNPAVPINKGGVYIARSQAAAASFFDLERVEVLKGPQGTLYGRNATGGTINLIPIAPELGELSGYVSVDVGNYNARRIDAAINVPVNEELALRVSIDSLEHDGYLSDETNDADRNSVRLQALWQPGDLFSMLVSSQYSEFGGKGVGYSYAGAPNAWESITSAGANAILSQGAAENGLVAPSVAVPPWITGPIVGSAPTPPFPPGTNFISFVDPIVDDTAQDMTFYDINAVLTWDFDFATLTIIPSFQKSEMHYTVHPGLRYETLNPLNGEGESSEATSFEARLSNENDKMKWVTGVFVYDESQVASVNANNGLVQNTVILGEFESNSLGFFAEMNYSLTDTMRIIAGIRYSEDEVDKNNFRRYYVSPSLQCIPFPPTAEVFNGVTACQIGTTTNESVRFESTDWKLGLEHDLNETSMLFATISTGYKAGGISQVAGRQFKPEELTSFEIGTRNMFFDGRLKVNADIFYWDYTDHQEFIIGPDEVGIVGQSIINAGDATIKGINVDIAFAATYADTFTIGFEFLDANYDEFTYIQSAQYTPPGNSCNQTPTGVLLPGPTGPIPELLIDCSGFQMNRAADWSGSASYTHTFSLNNGSELDASVDVSFTDDRWLSANFLPEQRADGHAIWNARVNYRPSNENLSLMLYVQNITEEESFLSSTVHSQVSQLVGLAVGQPRTYGIKVNYNF